MNESLADKSLSIRNAYSAIPECSTTKTRHSKYRTLTRVFVIYRPGGRAGGRAATQR